jgi:hypothetical protein
MAKKTTTKNTKKETTPEVVKETTPEVVKAKPRWKLVAFGSAGKVVRKLVIEATGEEARNLQAKWKEEKGILTVKCERVSSTTPLGEFTPQNVKEEGDFEVKPVAVKEKKEKKEKKEGEKRDAVRGSWEGFAQTGLIRWLAVAGGKFKTIKLVLKDLNLPAKDATVQTQIYWGRNNKAAIPALNKKQEDHLRKLLKNAEVESAK